MEDFKIDIETQISKTNKEFYNFRGKLIYEELSDDDIVTLETLLTKVSKNFKAYNRLSIVSTIFLIVLLFFVVFDILKLGKLTININMLGLIIMTLSIIKSTYTFYKVKVNLENKIFLLKLLYKIEMK
jgi:hypothetical protein